MSSSRRLGTDFVGLMCLQFLRYFLPSDVCMTYDLGVSCLRSTVPCFHLFHSCLITTFSPVFRGLGSCFKECLSCKCFCFDCLGFKLFLTSSAYLGFKSDVAVGSFVLSLLPNNICAGDKPV